MEKHILLLGGIGDFLQCIPYIEANKEKNNKYYVVTHLSGASSLFKSIGIVPEFLEIFTSIEEQNAILHRISRSEIIHCPRSKYFSNIPFGVEQNIFDNNKPVVGVHINGSTFSLSVQKKFRMILKSIPAKIIKELVSENYNLMVFGLEKELKQIRLEQSENLAIITFDNPAKSLAYVNQCNVFVGSDSGFKTMSAMSKIPTFVWLGDYIDEPRDKIFIDPYVQDGVMDVFRYKDVNLQFSAGMTKTKIFIERFL
jgi:hypothetical protein